MTGTNSYAAVLVLLFAMHVCAIVCCCAVVGCVVFFLLTVTLRLA